MGRANGETDSICCRDARDPYENVYAFRSPDSHCRRVTHVRGRETHAAAAVPVGRQRLMRTSSSYAFRDALCVLCRVRNEKIRFLKNAARPTRSLYAGRRRYRSRGFFLLKSEINKLVITRTRNAITRATAHAMRGGEGDCLTDVVLRVRVRTPYEKRRTTREMKETR